MFKKLALFALAAALSAGAAKAAVVYDNTSGPYFYLTGGSRALDDGNFDDANTTPTTVDSFEAAYYITPGDPTDVYMDVTFYDTLVGETPANRDPLGSFTIPLLGATTGFFSTDPVALATPIVFPDNDWAVDIAFRNAAGGLSDRAAVIFSGGDVTVGSSQDVFMFDNNGNNVYDEDEFFWFGGEPGNAANFYLKLQGTSTVIPEPGTMALLGAGLLPALGLIRRRRA